MSQLVTEVPVSEGVFTVILNASGEFGPTAFNGEPRWLQIEVCADAGCASLSILSPRQPVSSAPYALSTSWNGLSGVPNGFADGVDDIGEDIWETSGTNIFLATGNVGVGTAIPNPSTRLNVLTVAAENTAILGEAPLGNGVVGTSAVAGFGATAGVNSVAGGIGIFGEANTGVDSRGVWGQSNQGTGVYGASASGRGVVGRNTGTHGIGVIGEANSGETALGVWGRSTEGFGVYASGPIGIAAFSNSTHAGQLFGAAISAVGENGSLAGRFEGNVLVNGSLLKSKGVIGIDHPLDPGNKFLFHSSVDSPDMKNIYDGIIVTDEQGFATVLLPDYFEAFNKDFRYQLTVLDDTIFDDFVQAKVVKKIEGNSFKVRTSRPYVEVSWQVTGVRNDAYAKAHPMEVEKMKSKEERGKYLVPELYGQPKEKGIHYHADLGKASSASTSTARENN